jgi:phosphatidylserine/phosphatidylglycerophosphate/cardiolipin synthase-like enzyme
VTVFERAAESALGVLGASGLCTVADRLAAGWSAASVQAEARVADAEAVKDLLGAGADLPTAEVVAYLRGLARGYARHAALSSAEPVWSGPSTHAVPVRSMAQALLDVIAAARSELVLMTYSAKTHAEVRTALAAAVERGVSVVVVVETLAGAGSALNGAEPAAAFHGLLGVAVWHWPSTQRGEPGAKMHAKIAVADRSALLVSSANLTQSGVAKNIEAGMLVRGGTAPPRAAEHIDALRASKVLRPLTGSAVD